MASRRRLPLSRGVRLATVVAVSISVGSAIVATGAGGVAPPASAASVGHFLCYAQTPKPGSFNSAPSKVQLIDRWHSTPYNVNVLASSSVCNPAIQYLPGSIAKSPNPNAHLVCYGVHASAASAPKKVAFTNAFGASVTLVVGAQSSLCLPTWKSLSATPTAAAAQPPGLDHYTCYVAIYPTSGGPTFKVPSSLAASDEFSPLKGTKIQLALPGMVCVPTTKIVAAVTYPASSLADPSLVCFSSTPTPKKSEVFAKNQFGTGTLAVTATKWFCTPSKVVQNVYQNNCRIDAEEATTAIQSFNAQSYPAVIGWETRGSATGDVNPGVPSSFGRATQARRLITGQYLIAWPPIGGGYALAIATGPAAKAGSDARRGAAMGDVMIYVPANSKTPVDFSQQTATNGCNAL